MKPHTRTTQTAEMFLPRLDEQFNMQHPLIRLAGLMDWELIGRHVAGQFVRVAKFALPPSITGLRSARSGRAWIGWRGY